MRPAGGRPSCCWPGTTPDGRWTGGDPSTWPASPPKPSPEPASWTPDWPITLAAAEPVIVDADSERLRGRSSTTWSGNALQHTPPGSPVTVTVTGAPGRGQLTVADQGPGMTAEQASRVFERFYRTDGARTRARGGAGLGLLAIAASLAAAHGREITVDTAPGCGCSFPCAPAAGGDLPGSFRNRIARPAPLIAWWPTATGESTEARGVWHRMAHRDKSPVLVCLERRHAAGAPVEVRDEATGPRSA